MLQIASDENSLPVFFLILINLPTNFRERKRGEDWYQLPRESNNKQESKQLLFLICHNLLTKIKLEIAFRGLERTKPTID